MSDRRKSTRPAPPPSPPPEGYKSQDVALRYTFQAELCPATIGPVH